MLQSIEVDQVMGSKFIFVGLDGEMAGTELFTEKAKLCQIGIAFSPRKTFVSDIGWGPSDYVAQEQELAVNKFTRSRIELGPLPSFVDEVLSSFLLGNGAKQDKKILIPVGFNVGRFDMPFVEDALPKTASLFSRRTVDLNAICFALDGLIEYEGSVPKWSGWKRLAKAYAKETMAKLNVPGQAHDAGWDAVEALLCFEFLRSIIKKD